MCEVGWLKRKHMKEEEQKLAKQRKGKMEVFGGKGMNGI
jgi:hypothetical protein